MKKKPAPNYRRDDLVQVVVSSFPKQLRAEIKASAERNRRSLAAEITQILSERMEERRQAQAA